MCISGIYAGSVYRGQNMRSRQRFPGLSHHDGSAIVVKTHYPMLRRGAGLAESVKNAIILIRNPLNVFKAEFKRGNFKHYGPDQWPPPGISEINPSQKIKLKYQTFWRKNKRRWISFYEYWLDRNNTNTNLLFVDFQDIIDDKVKALKAILSFAGHAWTEEHEQCMLRNQVGNFVRTTLPDYVNDWIDEDSKHEMRDAYARAKDRIREKHKQGLVQIV